MGSLCGDDGCLIVVLSCDGYVFVEWKAFIGLLVCFGVGAFVLGGICLILNVDESCGVDSCMNVNAVLVSRYLRIYRHCFGLQV